MSDRSAEEDADIEVLHCHITGCLATQAKVCGTCGNHICTTHYVNSPVAGEPKMCLDCEERHPLRRYNMLDATTNSPHNKEACMGITTEGRHFDSGRQGRQGQPGRCPLPRQRHLTGKPRPGKGRMHEEGRSLSPWGVRAHLSNLLGFAAAVVSFVLWLPQRSPCGVNGANRPGSQAPRTSPHPRERFQVGGYAATGAFWAGAPGQLSHPLHPDVRRCTASDLACARLVVRRTTTS